MANVKHVTHYCANIWNRFLGALTWPAPPRIGSAASVGNIVTCRATVIYHIQRRGFFGILTDTGKRYVPFNTEQFGQHLQDRSRVLVTLECYPGVRSFYPWGQPARVVAIQPLP